MTELVASRVSPLDIGATLAVLIDVTVRRAIELVVDGDERPDFAWLSLGSVARREALPSSDIDSALVWGGGESHHEGADAAKTIHDILDLCGFPRDTKNAVATQARFARTLPQWRTALRKWVSNPYQTRPWSCCRCWRMPASSRAIRRWILALRRWINCDCTRPSCDCSFAKPSETRQSSIRSRT